MRTRITHPDHDRDQGLGHLALAWISYFLIHGPGDVQGAPLDPELEGALPIDPEFGGIIVDLYALRPTGRRMYDSAFISRAKGRAKSELAGWITVFEALGPCRIWRDEAGEPVRAQGGEVYEIGGFRWEYEPGEFIGAPIRSPFIKCLATEENQTGNTYGNVLLQFEESARLKAAFGIGNSGVGVTGIKLPGGGEIVPATSAGAAKDGGKETFVVFDETHLYITAELHRLYRTVTRNLDKRKAAEPWGLETSTMYAPGEGSIAEETHTQAVGILEGSSKIDNVFFDHRQADPDTDVGNLESITDGLREAYGPSSAWMDLARMAKAFFDKRRKIADQRRYFLNQPTSTSDAWIAAVDWERTALDEELQPGDRITLGFDGSQKRARGIADATALIACRVDDGLVVPVAVWEQPEGPEGDGWEVPMEEVLRAVDECFDVYTVAAFYADPPLWQETVVGWEAKYGEQLTLKASARSPIAWWTNRRVLMGRALDLFEGAVLDNELKHNAEDHVLTRHVLNAKRRPGSQGMQIFKDTPKSRKKIDAAVAAVLAFQARADVLAAGLTEKKRRPFKAVTIRPGRSR